MARKYKPYRDITKNFVHEVVINPTTRKRDLLITHSSGWSFTVPNIPVGTPSQQLITNSYRVAALQFKQR